MLSVDEDGTLLLLYPYSDGVIDLLRVPLDGSDVTRVHSFRLAEDSSLSDSSSGQTKQEKQVLTMCSHGYSNADIAQVLDVSPSTINTYITRASRKMGVASKREAVALWTKTIGL